MSTPYVLTPADIADLRASVSGPMRAMGGFVRQPVPHLVYIASDDAFALLKDGYLLAKHANGAVLCALMRAERQEPGFIARILSTAEDPERALDDAPTRSTRHANAEAARQAAEASREAAEAADWKRRRLATFDPAAITLNDLD